MPHSRMSPATLGALTLWTPVYTLGLGAWFLLSPIAPMVTSRFEVPQEEIAPMIVELTAMIILTLGTLVVLALTTVYYAVHIVRNPRLREGRKAAWSVANVMVGPFVMPFYWYLYCRREPAASGAGRGRNTP